MENGILQSFALALWSLSLGALLCAVYDIMRLFRLLKKQNAVLLFFADIAFSLFATAAVCILFFNLSNGKMRAYPLVLITVGFLIWRFTVSKAVMRLMKRLMLLVSSALSRVRLAAARFFGRILQNIYTAAYCKRTVNKIRKIKPKRKEN